MKMDIQRKETIINALEDLLAKGYTKPEILDYLDNLGDSQDWDEAFQFFEKLNNFDFQK